MPVGGVDPRRSSPGGGGPTVSSGAIVAVISLWAWTCSGRTGAIEAMRTIRASCHAVARPARDAAPPRRASDCRPTCDDDASRRRWSRCSRGPRRSRVVDLALACHPGPTVAVTVFAVAMAAGAGAPAPHDRPGRCRDPGRAAVGRLVERLDRRRTATPPSAAPDKPVGAGRLAVSTVRTAALVARGGVRASSRWRSAGAPGWCTWRPSRRRGRTTSGSRAPSGRGRRTRSRSASCRWPSRSRCPVHPVAAWWAMAAGALLGIGAHGANVVPDLQDDRATGVRGLPHRVGGTATSIGTALALVAATVLRRAGAAGPAAGRRRRRRSSSPSA